jgi:hypothetical protein
VSASTTGADLDPDGYTVTVDGSTTTAQAVAVNGTATFANLSAGSHTIALSGLAANCSSSNNPQTVTVTAGATTTATFSVSCQATTGSLTVSATTTGSALDPDGYTVAVDGGPAQALGINGSVTFTNLNAGSHTVTLSGIAANCSTSSNPQTVSVVGGTTAQTTFAVNCVATSYTFVGAGDVGVCASPEDEATAKLLDAVVASDPGATVFVAGDIVYDAATASEYANCYVPTWGRHKARTYAALGNHEYEIDPNPTWDYFGERAGPRGKGYYSFDLGAYWHVIVLNDNASLGGPARTAGSTQDTWLQADLAANTKPCTIAIWHQPYVASDGWVSASRKIFWDRLYAAGAEIVLNGHVHWYERQAPQKPDRVRDDERGIREFIVGTGGGETFLPATRTANTEVVSDVHGVLKLTLGAGTYSWQFMPVAGKTFTDSGSGTCH